MIFFQMMAKYPDVVKRAHLEIDSITQKTRLPTLDDRTDLPIVDCIMKEVFRFAYHIDIAHHVPLTLTSGSIHLLPSVNTLLTSLSFVF